MGNQQLSLCFSTGWFPCLPTILESRITGEHKGPKTKCSTRPSTPTTWTVLGNLDMGKAVGGLGHCVEVGNFVIEAAGH